MSRVLIIDYGLCNLDSVRRAVEDCGGEPWVSSDPADAAAAERIVLPGVGNFAEAMRNLAAAGWPAVLREQVLARRIPLLGICLGMQLLAAWGEEGGGSEGLGLIPGKVVRMTPGEGLRVPHVGWNTVVPVRADPLFEGLSSPRDYYFVHSYSFHPEDAAHVLAETPYGIRVVSVVARGAVYGAQFHPEKSLRNGFALLRNFLHGVPPC